MEIIWLIFRRAAFAILSIAALGFLYLYFVKFAHPTEVSKLEDVKDMDWHTIAMSGNTLCSDGSAYEIYMKKGSSENLIVYFAGGGACWDSYTASKPISLLSIFDGSSKNLKSFYFPKLQWFYPIAMGGIGDCKDSKNAFKDWNIVFIPYCTGDMHIGNTTRTYVFKGRRIVIHHNGRNNSLAALDWVFENLKNPGKIIVAGESTGAFASAFYTPFVADHYPGKKVYALCDGAMLSSDRWKEILDTVWNADSKSNLGFTIGKDIFEDALIHRSDSEKRQIRFLHSNTLYDDVFPKFSAVLNHKSTEDHMFINEWAANTRATMQRLAHAEIDYHYFLTDWGYDAKRHATQHTLTANEFYHACTADGISYAQWLKRNVIDDEQLSVGQKLLEKELIENENRKK